MFVCVVFTVSYENCWYQDQPKKIQDEWIVYHPVFWVEADIILYSTRYQ